MTHDHTRAAVKPGARRGLIGVPTLETDLGRLALTTEATEAQTVEDVSAFAILDPFPSEHLA
ncbi:MAG: hypothetical protein KDK29_14450 [Sedimentitalea sp.]|nr:hypothetical protein [Sedimentitalea sp.]